VAPATTIGPVLGAVRPAISPDGRSIAFSALESGRLRLWVRDLASETLRSLPGTEGATHPFWSPDSRSVAFFAQDWLKRVDLDGGAVRVIAVVNRGTGGAWSRHGVILFSSLGDPLATVSATGGEAVELSGVLQQGSNFYPAFLPDGRRFLYYVRGTADARGVYVGSLDGNTAPRRLIESSSGAVYTSGHVLFVHQRALLAQALDPETLQLIGNAFTVAPACDCQAVSASSNGTIVYRPGGSGVERRYIWFDRAGKEHKRFEVNEVMSLPALSRDETQVLGYRGNPNDGNVDVWSFDLVRGAFNRLTSDVGDDVAPVWSPDGMRFAFASNRKKTTHNIYIKAATAAATEELLLSSAMEKIVNDWSADGKYVLFEERSFARRSDLMAVTTDGQARVLPVSRTDFEEVRGQFSPDGLWVAYQSDATGRPEIHVQAFPGAGNQKTVSTSGGTQVRWGRDGKELFYITLDGRLMTVPLTVQGADVQVGAPAYLFTPPLGGGVQEGDYRHQYAVTSDGQRFLVAATMAPNVTSPIGVIQNWTGGGRSTANGSR
jgi:Tol biopolymer transport system component